MVVDAMRAEAEPGGMTVIVKRYSDISPEEDARTEEGEANPQTPTRASACSAARRPAPSCPRRPGR